MLRLELHLPLTKLTSERRAFVDPSNNNRADYSVAGVSYSGTEQITGAGVRYPFPEDLSDGSNTEL